MKLQFDPIVIDPSIKSWGAERGFRSFIITQGVDGAFVSSYQDFGEKTVLIGTTKTLKAAQHACNSNLKRAN